MPGAPGAGATDGAPPSPKKAYELLTQEELSSLVPPLLLLSPPPLLSLWPLPLVPLFLVPLVLWLLPLVSLWLLPPELLWLLPLVPLWLVLEEFIAVQAAARPTPIAPKRPVPDPTAAAILVLSTPREYAFVGGGLFVICPFVQFVYFEIARKTVEGQVDQAGLNDLITYGGIDR